MTTALNIETRQPLFIRAGVTPGFPVGGRSFVNTGATLTGWVFLVQIPGITGLLEPDVDFTYDPDTNTVQLTQVDYATGAGEKWVLTFEPRAAQGTPTGPSATKFSNGFDVVKVMDALSGRVRWDKPTRSDFPFTLSGDNVWGDDDYYSPVFQSVHKIVDPYTIWISQPDPKINEANFNKYLQDLRRHAIQKSLKSVFNKKEFLEVKLLFERFGRQDYININENRFVGARIRPAMVFDKSIQIDSVAMKFDGDVSFKMYLFHDTQPGTPLKSWDVTANANEQTIFEVNEVISYAGSGKKSGVFYIGYFQRDLGAVRAINEIISQFNTMYNFGVVPVELPVVGPTGIDINQISFTAKTHGFNIQLSAFRDFTQLILQRTHLFDNLVSWQVAADVIELINVNQRSNKDQRISAELTKMLYADLNMAKPTEEMPFMTGLKSDIMRERKRVQKEFYPDEKMNTVRHDTDCMNTYGVLPIVNDSDGYY